MVRVDRAGETIEERCAFDIVTEDGFVKLLEAEVDGGELREVKDVGILSPEWYYDGLGFVETQDEEMQESPKEVIAVG